MIEKLLSLESEINTLLKGDKCNGSNWEKSGCRLTWFIFNDACL